MKKNRNTFFTESQMAATNMNPNMGMPMSMPGVQSMQSNMGYYPNQMMPTPLPDSNHELEARLTKMERQIHRLESRINKLEGNNPSVAIDIDEYNSSMYMI